MWSSKVAQASSLSSKRFARRGERYSLLEPLIRHWCAFARTFPLVFGATHFNRNAKRAVITPVSLVARQSFPVAAVITNKDFRFRFLLNSSHRLRR